MLELWNGISLGIFDLLLGWLLDISPDAVLCLVAAGSAVLLTLLRKFTTNQDLLRRVVHDKKRLKLLIREARARRDREAVQRHQRARSMVLVKSLRQEGLPLLVVILPIALLATWCLARLEFHPPRPGEPVRVVAYLPVSRASGLMHIVPQPGIQAERGWIRRLQAVTDEGPPHASASWILRGESSAEPYRLVFRLEDSTLEHDLLVGRRTYPAPVVPQGDRMFTEIQMRPFRLFHLIPGIPAIYLSPWLVAYLLIVIPLVPLTRRLLRVY